MKLPNTLFGEWPDLPALAHALGLGADSWEWRLEDTQRPSFLSDETSTGGRWHNSFIVVADSLALVRCWLPLLANAGKSRSVHLLMPSQDDAADGPKTVTQLSRGLAAAQGISISGYRAVSIRNGKWVQVHHAVAAAAADYLEAGPQPLGLRVGLVGADTLSYAAGDVQAAVLRPEQLEPDEDDIFPADVLVARSPLSIQSIRHPIGILDPGSATTDNSGWSMAIPPVDTSVLSPRGFEPYPQRGSLRVTTDPRGLLFKDDNDTVAAQPRGRPLDEIQLSRLRPYGYVDIGALPDQDGNEVACLASCLAVAGVPILGRPPTLLGPDVGRAINAFDPADPPILREAKSIAMRRAALELFEPATRWNHWGSRLGLPRAAEESVSVVLASRRPHQVRQAVRRISRQTWKSLEIVLVLHGVELGGQEQQIIRGEAGFPLTILQAPAGAVLGEVLNIGVHAASGDFITKMDDDDWYAPDHIRDLVLARRHSRAVLVGSQVEFVYMEDIDITTRRPPEGERYTTHVAGGTMFIAVGDLRHVGGWQPVHRAVDRCLLQSVDAAGGSIYRTHGQNYVMHRYAETPGHGGHTWSAGTETFVHSSREQWDGIALPPAFAGTEADYIPPGRTQPMKSMFS
ncbi:glycosyltransferase [Arthrobacter sp.]|uniref:glycosyltransferase family 2 protein n=1 Tax=Arthrobacter sp. TaxID=1667 RepID=UPI002897F7FA|nr:glycosyltransferase [Arthrobacter sp.]